MPVEGLLVDISFRGDAVWVFSIGDAQDSVAESASPEMTAHASRTLQCIFLFLLGARDEEGDGLFCFL